MCLIISKPATTDFDDAFLQGVYDHNSDGVGVMYAENNTLHTVRMVPLTFNDFKKFYDKYCKGKQCAIHARMRTHGDVDIDNCHPYEILGKDSGYPISIMHNGILSTGNKSDVTKSDTWHYITNFLRPILKDNPKLFMNEAFQELVSSHIGGGNKFVFMDAYGNEVILGRAGGVEHKGAWLSNTYAWDTTGTEHDFAGYRNWGKGKNVIPLHGYGSFDFADYGSTTKNDPDLDYASELFSVLKTMKFDKAYKALTYKAVCDFYEDVGFDSAYEFIDYIEQGVMSTDEEIIDWVLQPMDFEKQSQLTLGAK